MSTTSALDSAYSNALGSAISSSTGGSDLGKEEFLQLLVTQFQYQDPHNPMEDNQFIAQLAHISSLEKNIQMNENLENLLSLQQQQTVIGAANYIGKTVSARGYGISWEPNSTGTGGKASTVDWATGEDAASVTVNILDSSGSLVNTYDLGASTAGSINTFKWDGKNSMGSFVNKGVYTVSFVAKTEAGKTTFVDTQVSGVVNGVSNYNGVQYVRLEDGRTATLDNIREVVAADEATEELTGPDVINVTDGKATVVRYYVPQEIRGCSVTITDARGEEVYKNSDLGVHSEGTFEYEWDAKDSEGNGVEDGQYRAQFFGIDADNNMVAIECVPEDVN